MSGYKNFAVVGAGVTGNFIVRQLLKDKAAGTVNEVIILTRQVSFVILGQALPTHLLWQGSNIVFDGDARVISVEYSNKQSIKDALDGVDVVVSTIASAALGVQAAIAEAAKEAGVKLFVPSEFGVSLEGSPTFFDAKTSVRSQLRALGLPYALFYTGPYADWVWQSCVSYHLYLTVRPTVEQVPRPQYHERESVCRWRWQQAYFVYFQA